MCEFIVNSIFYKSKRVCRTLRVRTTYIAIRIVFPVG